MPGSPREIRWLKRALASLDAEAAFIARDHPAAAASVVEAIATRVELPAQYAPWAAPGRSGRVEGTRELLVPDTPYLARYRGRGHAVEILRVFHGARKWPKKL
ncbi:MAG TPA: type II toxin-antitoxin system RelE/ParE family toxin [Terriglobia bacterium]|nr:type II toxin-antitoxin system RelE/ParE family toxin [Terriglobia bacterium]